MAVTCVDIQAELITVVDPHYDDKYFVVNYITFDEFEEMIKKSLQKDGEHATTWLIVYKN